ncbi:hypothetical protein ACIPY2_19875 [Paenarthrobacter sp. NPDC089675]|uniref:hypothetical protein n=1 Tax=Paenarthrobacter TaxID=1742992 RepID=UPI0037FF879A
MLNLTVLEQMDFEEPRNLWTMSRKEPPRQFGVYVVLRRSTEPPAFLEKSTGGTYRKDPSTPASQLHRRWVDATPIMYIGAAGLRQENKTTLRSRLSAYQRYGHGQNGVSHEGGNRIWQLEDVKDLDVTWKQTPGVPGKELEDKLLELFELAHDRLPFANGRH